MLVMCDGDMCICKYGLNDFLEIKKKNIGRTFLGKRVKEWIFGAKCIDVLRLKRADVLWPPLGFCRGENDWRNIGGWSSVRCLAGDLGK